MVQPRPGGDDAARAMRLALDEAAVRPSDVGYLNAHATSTPLGDAAEAAAIRRVFGRHAGCLPVSGTKGLYGHPLGASGAIEVAVTALALERGWLPSTTNLVEPDTGCELCHIAPPGRTADVDVAVTNSFGFGGINASLVLGRAPSPDERGWG
jgi:3-oxoacyl-[acyl-carrier-protein] synthase II